jgi:hypothetical protein
MHPYVPTFAASLSVWVLAVLTLGWRPVLILVGLLALFLLGIAFAAALRRRGQL